MLRCDVLQIVAEIDSRLRGIAGSGVVLGMVD